RRKGSTGRAEATVAGRRRDAARRVGQAFRRGSSSVGLRPDASRRQGNLARSHDHTIKRSHDPTIKRSNDLTITPYMQTTLEDQIGQWREYLRRRQAIGSADVEELEGHLRDQVAALEERGLDPDEAFLVAVKR